MAIVRDCGDFELKIGLNVGFTYTPPISRESMAQIATKLEELGPAMQQKREKMELDLLDFMCEQLGYDDAKIKQLVETRTDEERNAIIDEQKGRAEKNARRSGR